MLSNSYEPHDIALLTDLRRIRKKDTNTDTNTNTDTDTDTDTEKRG